MRKSYSWSILFIGVLAIFSCNSAGEQNKQAPATKAKAKSAYSDLNFEALYQIANQESLEIYNAREQQLLANENIGKLGADSFVKALIGIAEKGVIRKIFDGNKVGLKGNDEKAFFVVIEDNLPDDSIKADIRFFEMRKGEKSWNLAAVSSVWKCYQGRGHEDFSTALCH